MKRRSKLSRKTSRKLFRNRAGAHPKNFAPMPMRGGIRL